MCSWCSRCTSFCHGAGWQSFCDRRRQLRRLEESIVLMLRITYLPFRAMAETTRLILRHGGVAHEDEVVWGHEFATRREAGEFPFSKVSMLPLPLLCCVCESV